MHPLNHARDRAREERHNLGENSETLLQRVQEKIWDDYQIELVPVDKQTFLQGSRAEVVPAEHCLYYDQSLNAHPDELLEVVAHEYAHLALHHHLFAPASGDLIRGSVFLDNGAPALGRDLSPDTRPKRSMISDERKGNKDVEEKAKHRADHRSFEAA